MYATRQAELQFADQCLVEEVVNVRQLWELVLIRSSGVMTRDEAFRVGYCQDRSV